MVKQVTQNWLADGAHPAMEHVFEHIGMHWPLQDRENLFRIASYIAFPSNKRAHVWKGPDKSHFTVGGKFYYPIHASLGAMPNVWFKNLRLLQIRKKLNLIFSMRVSINEPSLLAREVLAKTKALEDVVGKDMMTQVSIPQMKKPRIRTTWSRIADERAEALRNVGLEARENRN